MPRSRKVDWFNIPLKISKLPVLIVGGLTLAVLGACSGQTRVEAGEVIATTQESAVMKRQTITQTSPHDFNETLARMRAAIKNRPLKLFAEINHGAGAKAAELELDPSVVFLFGNPKGGTPLMQRNAQMGLELPLRMLVTQSGDKVMLTYMDMSVLTQSYGLDAAQLPVPKIVGLLDGIANEVVAP